MSGDPSREEPGESFRQCPYCAVPIRKDAQKCSHCSEWVRRPVSALLGLAILIAPSLFAWFTLGKGRSSAARILAFSWLGFLIFLVLYPGPQGTKARNPGPHERAVLADIAAREKAFSSVSVSSPARPIILNPNHSHSAEYSQFVKNAKNVTVGMTARQVQDILGPFPTPSVQRSGSSRGTCEHWIYMFTSYYSVYLFFENGILVSWQEAG